MPWQDQIRHIVVLMLENQSFDRLLGFVRPDDPSERLDGVTGDETIPAVPGDPIRMVRLARATTRAAYVTDPCPGHQLEDIDIQIFGQHPLPEHPVPTMNGFLWNYAMQSGSDKKPIGTERAGNLIQCLDPPLVPIITTLAKSFVVCDRWFASVPGPTWPNRFFAHAATSNGVIDSPSDAEQMAGFLGSRFRMRTIFDNLSAAGRTWRIYFGDHAQAFSLTTLHRYAADGFRRLETFADDVAAGALASYTFLEPTYMDTPGNRPSDQHPPHHLLDGERLIAWVYDALRRNDAVWRQSLLVLLYDEHGGFYDHVPPPPAVSPDAVSLVAPKFKFDRLGVRVPALLISPWVRKGHADHRVYDHTSLLATLKSLFALPAFLTERDARANTLDGADFLDAPRASDDMPENLSALVAEVPRTVPTASGPSDLQRSLLALDAALRSPRARIVAGLGSVIDRLRPPRSKP